jgi:hypothetical protein
MLAMKNGLEIIESSTEPDPQTAESFSKASLPDHPNKRLP